MALVSKFGFLGVYLPTILAANTDDGVEAAETPTRAEILANQFDESVERIRQASPEKIEELVSLCDAEDMHGIAIFLFDNDPNIAGTMLFTYMRGNLVEDTAQTHQDIQNALSGLLLRAADPDTDPELAERMRNAYEALNTHVEELNIAQLYDNARRSFQSGNPVQIAQAVHAFDTATAQLPDLIFELSDENNRNEDLGAKLEDVTRASASVAVDSNAAPVVATHEQSLT